MSCEVCLGNPPRRVGDCDDPICPFEQHEPTIDRFPYFSAPLAYWVHCSCGRYRTGKSTDDLTAWMIWLTHRNAILRNIAR